MLSKITVREFLSLYYKTLDTKLTCSQVFDKHFNLHCLVLKIQLLWANFCNLNIYLQDSNECVFHSGNVAQALDFFGTLGEPGDSLDRTSKAEKSKGTSKDLLDSGNRTKNKKSEEESSEFRGKRKKRKRVTTKGEAKSSIFLWNVYGTCKFRLLFFVECCRMCTVVDAPSYKKLYIGLKIPTGRKKIGYSKTWLRSWTTL